MNSTASSTLRDKQTAATREFILDAAYDLLVNHPDEPFSHEAIARKAGVGARTVYRYFPAQENLFEELWGRVRTEAGTVFPTDESQILSQVPILFGGFDRNETLIRAVLESRAGHNVRQRGAPEGRVSFERSLGRLLAGRSKSEKQRIIAVFLAIYSAPFWQLLRERGGLTGPDAIAAASWAMEVLLDRLRNNRPIKSNSKGKS